MLNASFVGGSVWSLTLQDPLAPLWSKSTKSKVAPKPKGGGEKVTIANFMLYVVGCPLWHYSGTTWPEMGMDSTKRGSHPPISNWDWLWALPPPSNRGLVKGIKANQHCGSWALLSPLFAELLSSTSPAHHHHHHHPQALSCDPSAISIPSSLGVL